VVIRPAKRSDAAKLAEIGYRAWEDRLSVWASGQTNVASLRRNAMDSYLTFTSRSWSLIRVAEEDGIPVGWGAHEDPLDVETARPNAISDLWIDPDFQRRGHGAKLLTCLEDEIVEAGHETAELETHARNHEAIAFYRRYGYTVIWLSTVYSASLDRDIEKVGMSKRLVYEPEIEIYGPA